MRKLQTAENFNFSKGVENFNAGGIFGNLFTPYSFHIPAPPPLHPIAISWVAATANKATDAIQRLGTGYVGGEHYNAGQQFLVTPATAVINDIPGTLNGQAWRQLVWNNKPSGHFVRDADVSLYLQPTPIAPAAVATAAIPIGTYFTKAKAQAAQPAAAPNWWQRLFGGAGRAPQPPVQPTPQQTQPTYQQPVYRNGVWVYGYDQRGNPLDQYGNIIGGGYQPNNNYNPNAADYGQSQQDSDAAQSEAAYQAELDNE